MGAPLAEGCRALDVLKRETAGNAWFAVVSGVAHGGEVEYSRAQAVADLIAGHDPRALQDPQVVERLLAPYLPAHVPAAPQVRREQFRLPGFSGLGRLRGLGALGVDLSPQLGAGTTSKRIAAAARAFVKLGSPSGKLSKNDIDRIVWSVCGECRPTGAKGREIAAELGPVETTGIGKKAGALVREYLGDQSAVAVDRHIANFVFAYTGRLGRVNLARINKEERERLALRPEVLVELSEKEGGVPSLFYISRSGQKLPLDMRTWRKGDTIGPREFAAGEAVIRDLAHKCGVSPAAFQVAAWLQGACDFRGPGQSIPLVGKHVFRCGPVLGQRELPNVDGLGTALARTTRTARLLVTSPGVVLTV